ncbi:MAG: hypothetical protein V2A73_17770 [Pseudomonadota bacterium]
MRTSTLLALFALVSATSSCFKPEYKEGLTCAPEYDVEDDSRMCPPGQMCNSWTNRCERIVDAASSGIDSSHAGIDAESRCTVAGELGSIVLRNPSAWAEGTSFITVEGDLDVANRPDILSITLANGYGVMLGGFRTGSYYIDSTEAQYKTCGMCMLIWSDYDRSRNVYRQLFMAQSGSVSIYSVSENLDIELSNVEFSEVELIGNNDETVLIDKGCKSHLSYTYISVPISEEE